MRGRKPALKEGQSTAGENTKCPDWLTDDAKKEWRRVAPSLTKKGILRATDRAALASYCQSYARLREAELLISRHGLLVRDPVFDRNGNEVGARVKKSPAVQVVKDYHAAMLRAAALFGLNPQDRQRVAPDGDKPKTLEDELEAMGF